MPMRGKNCRVAGKNCRQMVPTGLVEFHPSNVSAIAAPEARWHIACPWVRWAFSPAFRTDGGEAPGEKRLRSTQNQEH
jgi:hypothetical protein